MTNKTDKPEIADSDCLEAFDHLYAYINNELKDQKTIAKIEHHLGHCKSCFSRAEMERKINERMKKSGKDEVPESLKNRLNNLMDNF